MWRGREGQDNTTVGGGTAWNTLRKYFHWNILRVREVGNQLQRSFGSRHWRARLDWRNNRPASCKLFHLVAHIITKILQHTKNIYFCWSDKKNRYNIDSFTLDGYGCVCCYFFYLTIKVQKGQCPWLNSQVFHVLKILAHPVKIASVC